jgi:heterodisulfide reductase subunit C
VARMRAVLRRASDVREQLEEVLHVGPVRLDANAERWQCTTCQSSCPGRSLTFWHS